MWPLPFKQNTTDIRLTFDPKSFKFNPVVSVGIENCEPLAFAIQKYNNAFLFKTVEGVTPIPDPGSKLISEVTITIKGLETECRNYPRLSDNPSVYESCKSPLNI